MAYDNHRFCWHGIISTNVEGAKRFYPEVLGWKTQKMQMGDEEGVMFAAADGIPRVHLMAPPMEGVPSHWDSYLRVEDVDASTKKALAGGGKQLVPPTDIPPGRFSVVATPSGAALSLFHEADVEGAQNAPGGEGSIHWTELHSKNIEADIKWLISTFGFRIDKMPMPDVGTYYILKSGDAMAGGAMSSATPDAPAYFLTWVAVADCDAALKRVKSNGGQGLTEPSDYPGVGRMAVVQDPAGAVFGIIKPESQG